VNGYKGFNFKPTKEGAFVSIISHRIVFYLTYGYLPSCIDHIDGDKLNNEPANLRAATIAQNGMNRKSTKGSTSKYLGVCWDKRASKWAANITIKGKLKHLGRFENEREAASHRNLAAMEYFGEFASLNDIS
jgi:hypothetical protein